MPDAIGITPARAEELDDASIISIGVEAGILKATTRGGTKSSLLDFNIANKSIVHVNKILDSLAVDVALPDWYLPFQANTKVANPPTLPGGNAEGVSWMGPGAAFYVAHAGSAPLTYYSNLLATYPFNGGTFPVPGSPGTAMDVDEWSLDDISYIAIAHTNTPYITIIKSQPLVGSPITFADPTVLPPATARSVAWSPNGNYLAVAHATSPFVSVYKRSGDSLTKIANPASLPSATGEGVSWSPDGRFLAVASTSAPRLVVYELVGDVLTKLTDPPTQPSGSARGVAWSPTGEYLVLLGDASPYVTIYKRSGVTFTKLTAPATTPTGEAFGAAWFPNGEYLAVAHATSPYVTVYKKSGDTFLKIPNPSTLPTGNATDVEWSPDGRYMAVTHATSPYVTIYNPADKVYGGSPKRVALVD